MKWPTVKLSDVATTTSGGTPKRDIKEYYYGGSINWVKSGELHSNIINDTEEFITTKGVENSSAKIMPAGTILMAMYGATVGAVSELGIAAATNQAVCCIQPNKKIDRGFLKSYLSSIKGYLVTHRVGGAQPNLSQDLIRNLNIPLPPLAEQQRIAALLDKAEEIKRKREAAIAKLDEIKKNTFDDLLKANKKEITEVSLGDVCKFVRGPFGGALKKEIFKEDGYAIYEQQHAIYDQFSDIRYFIDAKKFDEMKRFELFSGDLIMSCSGTMGKIAIVPQNIKKGIINQALLKLTPSQSLSATYLKQYMESSLFQSSLNNKTHGATIKNVASVAALKNLTILLPSIELQKKIEGVIKKIEEQSVLHNNFQISHLKLFTSLQHQAFTTVFET